MIEIYLNWWHYCTLVTVLDIDIHVFYSTWQEMVCIAAVIYGLHTICTLQRNCDGDIKVIINLFQIKVGTLMTHLKGTVEIDGEVCILIKIEKSLIYMYVWKFIYM